MPLLRCANLVSIVAVFSLFVLVRVLAGLCPMRKEDSPSGISSARALLCYTGPLEAIAAILVLVLIYVITPYERSLGMQGQQNSSSRTESSDHSDHPHKLDDKVLSSEFDIFLSHSGRQKGFVNDLYRMLHSVGYTAFLDTTRHSLPPGDIFPPLILEAARRCRLAVVVLSDDFFSSKWPMIELCAFVQAQRKAGSVIKILPLFYKLSVDELKDNKNLKRWRMKWKALAKRDPKRINVEEWEHAVHILSKHQGVNFDPSGGESTYIQNILLSISEVVNPTIKYDTVGVQGEERLCKIIVANFEKLECSTPPPSRLMPSAPPQSARVCVLGMYGLPGSGKSTLSRCLCNHYREEFHGRTFYLTLTSHPTHEELLKISKDLLVKLTNFFDRVDLTVGTELGQVYSLLDKHLGSFSLFLVVDNITRDNLVIDFVERILRCNFRAGSKVLLVARTYSDLQRLLIQGPYGSVEVPNMNTKEAMRVLQQSAGSVQFLDSCAHVDESGLRDREIMEQVTCISSFSTDDQPEYLPSVVRTMGSRLRKISCRSNSGEWLNDTGSFWKKVQLNKVMLYKQEAVRELGMNTFDKLPERLRFLFLDIALFILPSSYGDPLRILSLIHDSTAEGIETDMIDLQMHGFLQSVEPEEIKIHDVFLDFAAINTDCCMYYLSSMHGGPVLPRQLPPPPQRAMICGLRAVVLERYEGHERFDFWEGFSSVKALVLKHCSSVRVLGLPVGLKSLLSLDIEDCPNFTSVEVGDEDSILKNVRSFTWKNKHSKSIMMQHQPQHWSMVASSQRPALMEVSSFVFKMRWLQNLQLINTGITRLEDVSRFWPHLRQLDIVEGCLEHFEVGTLPFLEDFSFDGDGGILSKFYPYMLGILSCLASGIDDQLKCCPRKLGWKNLLSGCSSLRKVSIFNVACFEDGLGTLSSSHLNTLQLGRLWYAASLPDLSMSASSLKTFSVWECRQLANVSFMCPFDYLEEVHIQSCPSLAHVIGLDHLYSLRRLWISGCASLQKLSGMRGLKRLEHLLVSDCAKLQTLSGLSGLVSLQEFDVGRGCPKLKILHNDLENLTKLVSLCYYQRSCATTSEFDQASVLNVRNLVNLEHLYVLINKGVMDADMLTGMENLTSLKTLTVEPDKEVSGCEMKFDTPVDLATGLGVCNLSTLVSIRAVRIQNVHNLASISGIGFLLLLSSLRLENLHNLSCLQGIENLINLQDLTMRNCDLIEELPSLSLLVNMSQLTFENCPKLKSLEGCDTMMNLRIVVLTGCKSMECFPLNATIASGLDDLRVDGSKFASRDVFLAQQHDKEGLPNLHALVEALAATTQT